MKIHNWGWHDGKYGAECEYYIEDGILYIHVLETNCKKDWYDNVRFWKTIEWHKFHNKWYRYAKEMMFFFAKKDFSEIVGTGYSHGGAILKIFCFLINRKRRIKSIKCRTWGAPKPSQRYTNVYDGFIDFYKMFDIVPFVPFWWKKPKYRIKLKGISNPYSAHANYNIKKPWSD